MFERIINKYVKIISKTKQFEGKVFDIQEGFIGLFSDGCIYFINFSEILSIESELEDVVIRISPIEEECENLKENIGKYEYQKEDNGCENLNCASENASNKFSSRIAAVVSKKRENEFSIVDSNEIKSPYKSPSFVRETKREK